MTGKRSAPKVSKDSLIADLTGNRVGHSIWTQRLDIREIISRNCSANIFGEETIRVGKFC
jgi:hypothetical protein